MHKHQQLIQQWLFDIRQPVLAKLGGEWVQCETPTFHPDYEYRIEQTDITPHPHAALITKKMLWPHILFEELDVNHGWINTPDGMLILDPHKQYRHAWPFCVGSVVRPHYSNKRGSDAYTILISSIDEHSFVGKCLTSDDFLEARPGETMQCLNVGFLPLEET